MKETAIDSRQVLIKDLRRMIIIKDPRPMGNQSSLGRARFVRTSAPQRAAWPSACNFGHDGKRDFLGVSARLISTLRELSYTESLPPIEIRQYVAARAQ